MLEALVSGDILEGLEALEAALEPTLGTDPAAVFCSFVDTAHRIIYDAVAEDRLGAAAKMASRLSDDVAEYFRAMLEHTSRPVMRQRLLQILYASDGGEGGGAAESAAAAAYGPLLDVTPSFTPELWLRFSELLSNNRVRSGALAGPRRGARPSRRVDGLAGGGRAAGAGAGPAVRGGVVGG